MGVDIPRQDFRGWIFGLAADDTISIPFFKKRVGRVVSIHTHGVIILIEKVAKDEFEYFKIADHFAIVQIGGFEDTFDASRVSVGELTFTRVLAQHVSVLDFKDSADAISHISCPAKRGAEGPWFREETQVLRRQI